jgi:nifR3 family TIM-barrel protein
MKDIKLAQEVASATVKVSSVPVTVKFRKGWDDDNVNAVEFAKAMEASGVAAIAVHGRTREQFYTGKADWDIISEVKKSVSIPVIANGDITDLQSCLEMYRQTGCDLVMIGRGSYGNPFVFKEISSYFKGESYIPPTVEQRMETMLRHIRLILETSEKAAELAIKEARKHAAWYMNGFYGSAKFRARCYNLSSYSEAEGLAEEFITLQKNR